MNTETEKTAAETPVVTAPPSNPPNADSKIVMLEEYNEELQFKLHQANAKIDQLTAAKAETDADEKLIQAKMLKGLSRIQAAASVKRQKEYEASEQFKKQQKFNAARAAEKAKTNS